MARWDFGLVVVLGLGCGGAVKSGSHGSPPDGGSGGVSQPASGGVASGGTPSGGVATGGVATGHGGTLAAAGAPTADEAGAAAASEGGASFGDPCAGVAAWCTPGETVCNPRLGKLTTCSECGVAAPGADGPDCVRLLVSDKESNGVCVVRGQTALECWQGSLQPRLGQVQPSTQQLFLPDDYSELMPGELRLCAQLEG